VNELKCHIFAYLLPERARKGYYGNVMACSFINENEGELGVFGVFISFKKTATYKRILAKNDYICNY
jgi:hypothetical protein